MNEKLKEYNSKAICPKCGYKKIGVWYCEKSEPMSKCWPYIDDGDEKFDGEHFHRQCERCHYEWFEKVLTQTKTK